MRSSVARASRRGPKPSRVRVGPKPTSPRARPKAALQVKADGYYGEWARARRSRIADESASRYRRRLVRDMQRHLAPGDRLSSLRFPDLRREDDAALNALDRNCSKRSRTRGSRRPRRSRRADDGANRSSSGQRTVVFNRRESFIRDMGLPCRRVNGGVQGMRRNAETLIQR